MPHRLSAVDASFLHLETPSQHMHVAGLTILDPSTRTEGRLTLEDVAAVIERRIHLVPRFRQKILAVPFELGRPVWVDDRRFELRAHLRRAVLPPPGGRRELADYAAEAHSQPLDRSRSLWEMHLIEGLANGQVALLTKVHHAMVDGIAAIDIATALFDVAPELRAVEPQPWEPRPEPSPQELVRDALREQITQPLRGAAALALDAVRAPEAVLSRAQQLASGITSLAAAGAPPVGPFNVTVGPGRRVALAEAPVSDFKLVKNRLGGTVNDVVLAALGGALHHFLERRGLQSQWESLRAMVPVSTRDERHRMAPGNRLSNIFVDIPVGRMQPEERLRVIVERTERLKRSFQAVGAGALMNLGSWSPPTLHALAARVVSRARLLNLVVSNVPGPQAPMYLAGAGLRVNYPLMPLAETVALSVAVTSLAGVMGFGFTADREAVPDVGELASGLSLTLEQLKEAACR